MILVISWDNIEVTTDRVVDWLDFYNARYIKIRKLFKNIEYSINSKAELNLIINRARIEISKIWFRRYPIELVEKKQFPRDIAGNINDERKVIFEYLVHSLKDKYWLNHPFDCDNKLRQLQIAEKTGLLIPKTIFTNNKKQLMCFIDEHKIEKLITKSYMPLKQKRKNIIFSSGTTLIDAEKELGKFFFPSIFQKFIEKECDIRSFYIEKKIYSVAILNKERNEDVRINYENKPIRIVPFKLPFAYEQKIVEYMKIIEVNCGSIDIIKGTDGEFYFLELNPIGHFALAPKIIGHDYRKKSIILT